MSNICIGLKKTCLGILKREERDKYNETGLKEGGEIEMSIYSASITRCTLLRLNTYLSSVAFVVFLFLLPPLPNKFD